MDRTSPLRSWASLFIESFVEPGDLAHPALPFPVLHPHDLIVGPVEVVGYVGYLLGEPLRGVAYDSPGPFTSTSNRPSQWGQATSILIVP